MYFSTIIWSFCLFGQTRYGTIRFCWIMLLSSNDKYNEFYLFENFKVVLQDLHVAAYGFLMKQRSTLRRGLDSGQWTWHFTMDNLKLAHFNLLPQPFSSFHRSDVTTAQIWNLYNFLPFRFYKLFIPIFMKGKQINSQHFFFFFSFFQSLFLFCILKYVAL